MSRKLPNYLRTYRRRAGLTQKELGFLLGCKTGAKVSRYEHYQREPSLYAILSCDAIFGAPLCDLFAGMYSEARNKVAERAKAMLARLQGLPQTKRIAGKAKVLSRLIGANDN